MKSPKNILKGCALFGLVLCCALGMAPRNLDANSAAVSSPSPSDDTAPSGLPLKPEREVKITTDEGTWISLDVSPDGHAMHAAAEQLTVL